MERLKLLNHQNKNKRIALFQLLLVTYILCNKLQHPNKIINGINAEVKHFNLY